MEACRIDLKKEDESYDMLIGNGIIDDFVSELKIKTASSYVIITDSNVKKYHSDKLLASLKKKNLNVHQIFFKAGEQSKTRKTKEKIENEMLEIGVKRDSCIIAFGGGVVGDMAGFVASTYLRGIPYIQIPTTLLAMADSSIGGKVGVDTEYSKNSIGAFYQPKKVIMDLNFLRTLPKDEFANGMVELIKHGLIKDKDFFHFIEKNLGKIFEQDQKILSSAIKRSCEIKSSIVSIDEKETGARKILNYGHTIGHAIESALDYKIKHGEAIAVGMHHAAKISSRLGFLDEGSAIRQDNLLRKMGFKLKLSHHELKPGKILRFMENDKKIINGKINFILLKSMGDAFVHDGLTFEDLKEFLEED